MEVGRGEGAGGWVRRGCCGESGGSLGKGSYDPLGILALPGQGQAKGVSL